MGIFALQSPAGGFLDEDLEHFNKSFDDWCANFESYDDALLIAETLDVDQQVEVVEITPLSYPKYFFHQLQGIIHATRQIGDRIICITEAQMGSNFRIAVCDLNTKRVKVLNTRYKSALGVEGAFANFSLTDADDA